MKKQSVEQKRRATLGGHFLYQWNNPPAPFNPDFDPNHKKWWSGYCARRRQALIAKYLELYPDGEVDGTHFGDCRNEILRKFVDQRNEEFKQAARREAGLVK